MTDEELKNLLNILNNIPQEDKVNVLKEFLRVKNEDKAIEPINGTKETIADTIIGSAIPGGSIASGFIGNNVKSGAWKLLKKLLVWAIPSIIAYNWVTKSQNKKAAETSGIPTEDSSNRISPKDYEGLVSGIEKIFQSGFSSDETIKENLEKLDNISKEIVENYKQPLTALAEQYAKRSGELGALMMNKVNEAMPYINEGLNTWRQAIKTLQEDTQRKALMDNINKLTSFATDITGNETLGGLLRKKYARKALNSLMPLAQTAMGIPGNILQASSIPVNVGTALLNNAMSLYDKQLSNLGKETELTGKPYELMLRSPELFMTKPKAAIDVASRQYDTAKSLLTSMLLGSQREEAANLNLMRQLATLDPNILNQLYQKIGLKGGQ